MSFLSPPQISSPAPPQETPKLPQQEGPEIQAARDRQRQMVAAMKGQGANWLTGPSGLTASAPVAQKMLFGS